ncbi:C-1-tetrahydrofolate synthase, cytoplasmic [Halotydeus destructor]|nr:C-1-tetrahydrofolate synthase, cytoplasmic [Halotydeus destructor]
MAQILSGRDLAKEIELRLVNEVSQLPVQPKLAIVQVGGREDSNVYIRMKRKFAEAVGVATDHFAMPRNTTEEQLVAKLDELNKDKTVHGIIVQLPFDCENKISADKITNLVSPDKDVDGLSDLNAGKLFHGQVDGKNCYLPCTPYGCLELIKKSGVPVAKSNCVVIGRSKIVGNPMAQLLLHNNGTVTTVHSGSQNVPDIVRRADIVVAAAGCPELVKKDWIKPGAVLIDCGITAVPDSTKKSGQRLVGDIAYAECKEVARAITPVPGGVGPMTVAMLISNTVDAAKKSCGLL